MMPSFNQGPLSGLIVLDLTRILAGPFCTMNLGDMGAEVIKIERPGTGDDTRHWGPPFVGGESAYFLGLNRNKSSVTLNLREAKGQQILRKLIKTADVLIENFKPNTLDNWGINDKWRESNAPKLVHCSITGYGERGPKGGKPGYDFLLQAESGLMSITGEINGGPTKLGVAIVDVCTGMYAAMAILAALNHRSKYGKGQRIKTSLFDASLSMLINIGSNYLMGKEEPIRYGNGHPSIVPYNEYPCHEGRIAIAVGNDGQFEKLAQCIGHPEWVQDSRFHTNPERVRNRDVIENLIITALKKDIATNWIVKLEAFGVPCSSVLSVSEALESSQSRENRMVETLEHPIAGQIRMLGIPYKFSDSPGEIRFPPPTLGADTERILQKFVNLDKIEIQKLQDDGII